MQQQKRKRPSIIDVARHANVSIASVSRCMKQYPGIAAATRARILASVAKLGYRPHGIACSLVMRQKRSLGLIVARGSRAYFDLYLADILDGVSSRATDLGWSVHLTMLNDDTPPLYLLDNHADFVEGSLILDVAVDYRAVRELIRSGHPSLIINHTHRRLPSIGVDNFAGGLAAARHLVEMGHRRIGILTSSHDAGIARLKGYRSGLKEAGLRPVAVVDCQFLEDRAQAAARDLLSRNPAPTALLVASDWMAIGVLREAAAQGRRVPEDLSIVGNDDAIIAETTIPPLTTIRHPLRHMGRRAFELMQELLVSGSRLPVRELLIPELVVRGSTGRVP